MLLDVEEQVASQEQDASMALNADATSPLLSPDEVEVLEWAEWKLKSHVTDTAYNNLPASCGAKSWYHTKQLMTRLAEGAINVVTFTCCVNSCEARTGEKTSNDACSVCGESYLHVSGKPRRQYTTFAIAPRLAAQWRSKARATQLLYRHRATRHHQELRDAGEEVLVCD